ncbi:MAG: FG-GAP repeat protein [Acidobacteriota bacterium]
MSVSIPRVFTHLFLLSLVGLAVTPVARASDDWWPVSRLTVEGDEPMSTFGLRVVASGDILVASRTFEDPSGWLVGSVEVFQRQCNGRWRGVAELALGGEEGHYPRGLALAGDTLVIGAHSLGPMGPGPGVVFVHERHAGGSDAWGLVAQLTPDDPEHAEGFGYDVAISGDTLVAGALIEDGVVIAPGAALVFGRNEGGTNAWGQVAELVGDPEPALGFGFSTAIEGDVIVVGAALDDELGIDAGAAYVFGRNEGGADAWGRLAKLTAGDADERERFGTDVAISGDTILVGARDADGAVAMSGAAYVYRRDGGGSNWLEEAKLIAADGGGSDWFGGAVALVRDIAVIGSPRDDGAGENAGSVHVFEREGNLWASTAELLAQGDEPWQEFGHDVSVLGNLIAAGFPGHDESGAVDLFLRASEDGDGDGVADEDDGCPDDPAKTEPGCCGCGVADEDRDGDGLPDCFDDLTCDECEFDALLRAALPSAPSLPQCVGARLPSDPEPCCTSVEQAVRAAGGTLPSSHPCAPPCETSCVEQHFEGLPTGTVVSDQFAGMSITSSTAVRVFDTSAPTCGDDHLLTPGRGPGNTVSLGHVLVLSEWRTRCHPNDSARGGYANFYFDEPRELGWVGLLDIDEPARLRAFDASGALLREVQPAIQAEGNGWQQVFIERCNVSRLEVYLTGTGAITTLSCLPPVLGEVELPPEDAGR